MGIGFDVFKANIGWNLADSVMNSVSNAIEKNAAENAERQKEMICSFDCTIYNQIKMICLKHLYLWLEITLL